MRQGCYFASGHAGVLVSLSVVVLFSGLCCRPAAPPDNTDGTDGTVDPCASPAILFTDVTANTTLTAGCYDVPGIVSVTAGLTVQPGVTLRFQAGAMLTIEPTGSLRAVGTAGEPITFTGTTASRGYWGGVRFLGSSSSNNRLEYVTIEYAGAAGGGGLSLAGDSSPAAVAISHCTLRQGAGYGLYASGDVGLTGFSTNTLTQNTQGACALPPNAVELLDSASSYQGNDEDAIAITDGTLTSSQIWLALGVRYLAANVQVAGDLTLSPGVTIAFSSGGIMNVTATGSLRALGAPGRPVTLTGAAPTPGSWQGLSYTNTSSVSNNLTLVTIEYGGAGGGNLIVDTPPVRVFATFCTFSHSSTCGVLVSPGATVNADVETANTFADTPGGTVCP